jgi:hypothetical protein
MTLGAEGSFGTSFDKIASIEFTKRLLEFGSGVHHDWPMPCDWLP